MLFTLQGERGEEVKGQWTTGFTQFTIRCCVKPDVHHHLLNLDDEHRFYSENTVTPLFT